MRCVYPKCKNTSRTRGLCHAHYQSMRSRARTIKKNEGHAAELNYLMELESRRLLMPEGAGGSPARDHLGAFDRGSEVQGYAN